ncbi:reverse transcriptase domain-containing protein [Tanacetum coccineum]
MTGGLLRGTPEDTIRATPAGIAERTVGSTSGEEPIENVETLLIETTPSAKEQIEGYLSALKSIVKEYNGGEMYHQYAARGWFENLSGGSIDGWVDLRQQFTTRFSTRRECFKDPTEITNFVRNANENLVAFKERWIVEIGFITGVSEVMKISSFMDDHKCSELAKRYSDKVPRTVDEMMTRVDYFVRSEEAFASMELPKEEAYEALKKSSGPVSRLEDRFHRGGYGADRRRNKGSMLRRGAMFNRTMSGLLKRQLEISLESGKLNHLIKDVRQRGRGNAKGRDAGKDKVINMIRSWPDEKKRKSGSIAGGDVRALLRELKSRYEVAIEEHSDGFSGFRRRGGETIKEDRIGGGLRRWCLRALRAVSSTIYSMIKFPTPRGITTSVTRTVVIVECRRLEKKQMVEKEIDQLTLQEEEGPKRVGLTEQALVNLAYLDQLVMIGGNLSEGCKDQLKALLKKSMDVFAWESADMTVIPRRIIEHYLNVNPSIEPVAQERRVMASDRTQAVQMALDDEEKMAFYTDHGTYCYTKMSFELKSAGDTYQRLVDTAFQSQIGRNLEAYVDDMVIKSNDEKVLIADIVETFDNLRRINMKLNPKKCSFGVEEGKLLRYMITFEGIWANPKKTKAITDMHSLRTLKEMQSLSGKLAALKRFLSRAAEKSFIL